MTITHLTRTAAGHQSNIDSPKPSTQESGQESIQGLQPGPLMAFLVETITHNFRVEGTWEKKAKPNVLFLVADDMRPWLGERPARTRSRSLDVPSVAECGQYIQEAWQGARQLHCCQQGVTPSTPPHPIQGWAWA